MKNIVFLTVFILTLNACSQKPEEAKTDITVNNVESQTIKPDTQVDSEVTKPSPKLVLPAPTNVGPFGIYKGMTWAELQPYKPMLNSGWAFELDSVPIPHELFINHVVLLSKETGVCKIISSSDIVTSLENGEGLRVKFDSVKQGLVEKYGPVTSTINMIKTESLFKAPKDWMLSLKSEERIYKAYWVQEEKNQFPNGIDAIQLEAKAINLNHGILILSYDFDNASECHKAWNAEKNNAL